MTDTPADSGPAPTEEDLYQAAVAAALDGSDDSDFEASVRSAIDPLPAQFLFHMRIDLEPAIDVAALVTTDSETAQFLIVRRTDGEAVTVEQAADSDLPIAALVPAYAGLAATLPSAH